MLKRNVNGRKIDPFEFKEVAKVAFELLRAFFIRVFMLIHFNSNKPIKIEINILEFAIVGILL
jgi:hypothetical protein